MKKIIFIILAILQLQAQNMDEHDHARHVLFHHKQQLFSGPVLFEESSSEHAEEQSRYDALYYKINMAIQYNPNLISATVSGRFRSMVQGLNSVVLDFDDNLQISAIAGDGGSFTHSGQRLAIELNRSFNINEEFSVAITYSGTPVPAVPHYFRFDTMSDNSPMVWTLSEPYGSRYWWPCKDRPSDKADSVDMIITVPDNQVVGSNGTLVSVSDNGDGTKTFHWQERYPIATYLVSLAVGNYAHFQDYYDYGADEPMLLDYYVYPDKLAEAREIFTEMHDYLDALSYYFGPYPFLSEKYGQAQFGWGGAMEHQTLTSIGRVTPGWRYVYVHELGHQWFGDLVTCASWSDIWLNEGFASYSEALYAEWAGFRGYPPGLEAYHNYMQTQQFRGGGTIFIEDTTSFSSIFGLIVYDKGSWVLHMLRGIVSDDIFFDILKSYAHDERWTYGSVRTRDFIEICESKSGLSLFNFFNQWLYYPFFPRYEYTWDVIGRDGASFLVEVDIEQLQRTIAYDMPVQLQFFFSQGHDTLVTVQNNQFFQSYLVALPEAPQRMVFDPNNWILKDADEKIKEPFSTEVKFARIGPNPFPGNLSQSIHIELISWLEQDLKLDIYDVLGRRVNRITGERFNQYKYTFSWDGSNQHGRKVASGVYFLRVIDQNDNDFGLTQSKKIIFLNRN